MTRLVSLLSLFALACGATAALPTVKPISTLSSPTVKTNMVTLANTSTPSASRRQAETLGMLNVRKLPNTHADIWGVLEFGAVVTVGTYIENDDIDCWRWYEVEFEGHSGWVCAEWLGVK